MAFAADPNQVRDDEMAAVTYRDAVTFSIPSSWRFEDQRGVQGVFYEDLPDSGTLRVSVFQWEGKDEADRNRMLANALLPGDVDTLARGVYLRKEVKDAVESGEALRLHRWIVALALPENVCRIVVFTHTVTAAQEHEEGIVAELALVEHAVRNAQFSYSPRLPLIDEP